MDRARDMRTESWSDYNDAVENRGTYMRRALIATALGLLCSGNLHAELGKSSFLQQRLMSPSSEVRKSVSSDFYGSGVADQTITDAIAKLVAEQLPTVTHDDDRSDEIAWHLKALGASGNAEYRPLIEQALASPNPKVSGYAKTALKTLDFTSKTGFPLLTRDKVRQITDRQGESCAYIRNYECSSMRGNDTCMGEFRYQAIEAGGDSFMLMANDGRGWLGRVRMTADLYNCRGNFTKAETDE